MTLLPLRPAKGLMIALQYHHKAAEGRLSRWRPAVTERRSLLLPGIVAAVAFAILVALGVWQVERKAWKEGLIATLDERMAAAPSPLAPRGEWQNLTPPADEFRRVRLRGATRSQGRSARLQRRRVACVPT